MMTPLLILKRLFVVLVLIGMVSSCGSSSKKVRFYRLTVSPSESNTDTSLIKPKAEVRVTVNLADFLNQTGIVTQLGPNELTSAHYHLWSEPLQQAVQQQMIQLLNQNQEGILFNALNGTIDSTQKYQLFIKFNNFQGSDKGTVLSSGQYRLYHQKNLIINHTFYFNEPVSGDGYNAVIQQLQQSLVHLSSEIALELKKIN